MNATAFVLFDLFTTIAIKRWLDWQALKARPPGYVWTDADIKQFLADIASDTPEKILAEAKAELGQA